MIVVTRNTKANSIQNAGVIGRNTGVDYVLFGTYSQIGESFTLDMRFVDVNQIWLDHY